MQGFWDGSFKDNVRSGCGVVVKGVHRERSVTISKIAIPLKLSASVAAEMLVCVCSQVFLI